MKEQNSLANNELHANESQRSGHRMRDLLRRDMTHEIEGDMAHEIGAGAGAGAGAERDGIWIWELPTE